MKTKYFSCAIIISFLIFTLINFMKNDSGRKMVEHSFVNAPTKSVCVGRYLIDFPESAIISYGGTSVMGYDLSTFSSSNEDFPSKLLERERILSERKNQKNKISLEKTIAVRGGDMEGKIYIYDRVWFDHFDGEKRIREQTVSVDVLARRDDFSYAIFREFNDEKDLSMFYKLSDRIVKRDVGTEASAGFCFGEGILLDGEVPNSTESTVVFVGFKEYPDIAIALSVAGGVDSGPTILERNSTNSVKNAVRWRFQQLRKRPREAAGLVGAEILERVRDGNDTLSHAFIWEAMGVGRDINRPTVSLEFDTGHSPSGNTVNSGLSDEGAVALWDKVLSSLRRRPIVGAASK
jgi:hypothetical protein